MWTDDALDTVTSMAVFARIAHLVTRHPVVTIVAWSIVAAGSLTIALIGVGQGGIFQRAEMGAPTTPGSGSAIAADYAASATQPGEGPRLTSAIVGVSPTDSAVAAAFAPAFATIANTPGVAVVVSPLGIVPGVDAARYVGGGSSLDPTALVATDGTGFVMVVEFVVQGSDAAAYASHSSVEAAIDSAVASLSTISPDARAYTFSEPLLAHDFAGLVEHDLLRGELVAVPIALLVMVFVFGGFLAASTPIAGALASIAAGLAALFGLSYAMTLNSSAVNIVSILGVGLSIDYGLLIVSRYREELIAAGPGAGRAARALAVERTLTSAGRTVFFSGLIVGLSVGGMLAFDSELMRGFGAAGLAIVVLALATALTLVPAVAFSFGNRLARPSVVSRIPGVRWVLHHTADVSNDDGPLARLAGGIQKRPWFTLGATAVLILILAAPVLAFVPRNSQVELLPANFERREFAQVMSTSFPALADPAILVVADTAPAALDAWLATAAVSAGVRETTPAVERNGMAVAGVSLVSADSGGPDAVAVVNHLRETPSPFTVYVGGQAASLADFAAAITQSGLIALGFVIVSVFVLLFLMTGSVVMPLKALIVNALSIAATLGIMVWLFQYGNLSGPLGFTPPGGIEIYVVIVLVCFGFGLAMDYEVFLLSRVKELVDAGVPNDQAVRTGLQRSGRVITSAAAIIILVFIGFAFGNLLIIKEVGFGLACAVFLDATLVRMLLVPATMSLLGRWNWWAPGPLRRLHARLHFTH